MFLKIHKTLKLRVRNRKLIFLIYNQNMLWVLKRIVSMRRFFWAPKTYALNHGLENIYNFTLKNFVYLNTWSINEECVGEGNKRA